MYNSTWDDPEQTTLIIEPQPTRNDSWTNFHELMDQVTKQIAASPHRVDVIFLANNNKTPPGNPLPHLKTRMSALFAQPNMGIAITVFGRGSFEEVISNLLIKGVRTAQGQGKFRLYSANSIDAARELIVKQREAAAALH